MQICQCEVRKMKSIPHRIYRDDVYRNTKFLFKVLTILSIIAVTSAHVAMGEQCDWTGSGFKMNNDKWIDESRAITPVYLRCTQGRISWVYPRGGLKVLLRLGSSGKDFRGCIKVNPTFAGARIFLEDEKNLKELYSPSDDTPVELPRCFYSRDGKAILYVEASMLPPFNVFPKYLAEFSYDLETMRKNSYNPDERCRPCDKEELMQSFCTTDLVICGIIDRIVQNEDADDVQIVVSVQKILKHSVIDSEYIANNVIEVNNTDISNEMKTNHSNITITMPKVCQSKPGVGQFIFMARKRFDDYSLVCAPREEEWKQLAWQENQKGNAHCILSY